RRAAAADRSEQRSARDAVRARRSARPLDGNANRTQPQSLRNNKLGTAMNERAVKFRVGVVVLSTIIITAILVILFSDSGFHGRPQQTLYVKFPEAPGVTIGTPVRKSGIL